MNQLTKVEKEFWLKFKKSNSSFADKRFGSSWRFGDSNLMANELAELVLNGEKTATTSALIQYERSNESLPKANSKIVDILLDGNQEPVAIIETTKVYVTTFDKVTKEHADKEGEGDKSLAYWKQVHLEFWTKLFQVENIQNTEIETMKVVCEEFKVLWRE